MTLTPAAPESTNDDYIRNLAITGAARAVFFCDGSYNGVPAVFGARIGLRRDCYLIPGSAKFSRLQEEAQATEERIHTLISPKIGSRIPQDRRIGGHFLQIEETGETISLNGRPAEQLIGEFSRFREIQLEIAHEIACENFPTRRRFPQNARMRELVIKDVMGELPDRGTYKGIILPECQRQRECPVTVEESFIESIAAAPGDPTPRLSYADWLGNRKQPGDEERGELIRLQCRIETLAPDDPDLSQLVERASRILEQYGEIWAARIGCSARNVYWSRGLIEGVRMDLVDFARAQSLYMEPVRSLTLPSLSPGMELSAASNNLLNIERLVVEQLSGSGVILEEVLKTVHPPAMNEILLPAGSMTPEEISAFSTQFPEITIKEKP